MTELAKLMQDHPNEYEQGRRARRSSINEQDAPYDAETSQGEAWKAGFDSAEDAAARDRTSGPVENQVREDTGDNGGVTDADTAPMSNPQKAAAMAGKQNDTKDKG